MLIIFLLFTCTELLLICFSQLDILDLNIWTTIYMLFFLIVIQCIFSGFVFQRFPVTYRFIHVTLKYIVVHGIVVACWTAGQLVTRSFLHQGHDSSH